MVNWQDILNPPQERNYRDISGPRGTRPPSNPGGQGPITTPGIPEDQVTPLNPPIPPPPTTPPFSSPSPEDILAPYLRRTQYTGNSRGPTAYTPPSGTGAGWVNPGETEDFWSGLGGFLGGRDGNRSGYTPRPEAPPDRAVTYYLHNQNDPDYTGPSGLQPGDSRFWNMPAGMQSAYFERMAISRIGDYDRSEPDIDPATGQPIPGTGGKIIGGPNTTAIRQLMADLEATARAQMMQGYQPTVRY